MPGDYYYLDEFWILPYLPWALAWKLEQQYGDHGGTYQAKHASMVAAGWVFTDFNDTGFGSSARMADHDTFYNAHSGLSDSQWTEWCNDGEPWLPFGLPAGSMLDHLHWLWYENETPQKWTDEKWNVIRFFVLVGNDQQQFYTGWLARFLTRFWQLKIAIGLENIYCLDNRGRPPKVVA